MRDVGKGARLADPSSLFDDVRFAYLRALPRGISPGPFRSNEEAARHGPTLSEQVP